MVDPKLLRILRQHHNEVIARWHNNCHGHIADEFEEMLETPMGRGVYEAMYSLALEYLEAEEYETVAIRRRARESASNASFRRAAVGFSLADIIHTAIAFRDAMQQILIERFIPSDPEESQVLLDCFIRLNELVDAMVAGEIAGFFTFSKFGDEDEGIAEAI